MSTYKQLVEWWADTAWEGNIGDDVIRYRYTPPIESGKRPDVGYDGTLCWSMREGSIAERVWAYVFRDLQDLAEDSDAGRRVKGFRTSKDFALEIRRIRKPAAAKAKPTSAAGGGGA